MVKIEQFVWKGEWGDPRYLANLWNESVLCILCFFFLIGRAQQVGLVGKRVGSSILGYLGYFRVYTIFQVSRNKEFTQNVSYTRQIG